GQKIQTLASQKFVAGKDYTFEWNGKDFNGKSVSTGIYFYKFELDGLSKTRKMVLAK
ncbi:hypothetical protein IT568_04620, partial [bacterium]|nr:hypothetical protein [bacterium]